MKQRRRSSLSTTQIILLSFLAVILLGSALLSLPCSTRDGTSVSYVDALFTATTATCVTGLVTLPTAATWSFFGQAVLLVLIQVGGLGIITVLSALMVAMHRKMGLRDSQLIRDSFNLNTLSGLAAFIRRVVIGTAIIEGAGALLYMMVFVPAFGIKGVWLSVFHSVSAFCNAGIDLLGENSFCDYVLHPLINAVTCLLILLGGLGYIVWWDLLRVIKDVKRLRLRAFSRLTLHSKIVLSSTAILVVGGALAILLLEYRNPLTIGEFSFLGKLQASFFQSITTRTAGFATLPQEDLTHASAILCMILMWIGGSPVGTAGGIKTATIAVLCATALSGIRGKNEVVLFRRSISPQTVRKAVAVAGMSCVIMTTSAVLLAAVTDAPALDILYESVSATATVGLTRALTPLLNLWGKLIIIATMYFGRIGPISLAIAFQIKKGSTNNIKNPTEEISVG